MPNQRPHLPKLVLSLSGLLPTLLLLGSHVGLAVQGLPPSPHLCRLVPLPYNAFVHSALTDAFQSPSCADVKLRTTQTIYVSGTQGITLASSIRHRSVHIVHGIMMMSTR